MFIVKQLTRSLQINNTTHEVKVNISIRPDSIIGCHVIKVECKCLGEIGIDRLDEVKLVNVDGVLETVLEYSMIDNAMDELKENIFITFNQIKRSVWSQ